jgi:hypothetical protein
MDPLACTLCKQTLCLPLIYPCGHSGACAACVIGLIPQRRNCPVCGVRSKTTMKKLLVNRTLDAILRHVRPNDFNGRALALDSAADVLLHNLLQLARAKVGLYSDDLPEWYLSRYESTVQRHLERATTCHCGLFCVPKGKIGTNRLYYGCPRWKAMQNKEAAAAHCGFWRWLSASESRIEANDS